MDSSDRCATRSRPSPEASDSGQLPARLLHEIAEVTSNLPKDHSHESHKCCFGHVGQATHRMTEGRSRRMHSRGISPIRRFEIPVPRAGRSLLSRWKDYHAHTCGAAENARESGSRSAVPSQGGEGASLRRPVRPMAGAVTAALEQPPRRHDSAGMQPKRPSESAAAQEQRTSPNSQEAMERSLPTDAPRHLGSKHSGDEFQNSRNGCRSVAVAA